MNAVLGSAWLFVSNNLTEVQSSCLMTRYVKLLYNFLPIHRLIFETNERFLVI